MSKLLYAATGPDPEPKTTTPGDALAGLLSGLGLRGSREREDLTDTVTRHLESFGFTAEVVSVRYDEATLLADPQTAALLRYDLAALTAAINDDLDKPLKRLIVQTRRRG